MRVLVALSGGVDSSVAAALALEAGHQVEGATLKLWGGPSDSGCCSVADVDDARRVAQQLSIDHHVFNLSEDFERSVVEPYVEAHRGGRTPNPCIECNRHIKFDRLLERARRLGFDALATGHHARVTVSAGGAGGLGDRVGGPPGRRRLRRGVDEGKDQSYVLSMLGQAQLADLLLPVGVLTKAEVRARAAALGLRTAAKPDSQDVCFIHSDGGRREFLGQRMALHPGVVEAAGEEIGTVEAVELVTVGQRRGFGHDADGARRYVVSVDVPARRVVVGGAADVRTARVALLAGSLNWVDEPVADGCAVVAQVSAHGRPLAATLEYPADPADAATVTFAEPQRPVAPGQTVAFYDPTEPDAVLGAGIVA